MGTIILENVPESIERKFGKKINFNQLLGLYWDGMDWCQFNEVIPDENEIKLSKTLKKDKTFVDGEEFLTKLLTK